MQVPAPRAADVLAYWFGRSEPPFQARMGLWFGGAAEVDEEIRDRFGPLIEEAVQGRLDHWAATPYGRVALVVVLDQFTRNAHRGTPRAFAGDGRAQRLVVEAIEAGEDEGLDPYARMFLQVALEHAEDHGLQDLAVARARALVAAVPEDDKPTFRAFQGYVEDHAGIVHRFGRFPDRNQILGRRTTDAEAAFLASETRGWFEDQGPPDEDGRSEDHRGEDPEGV